MEKQGLSLWRQVSEAIIGEIRNGRYSPGDRLPASNKLAKQFNVHQHTALKAISHLQSKGLLRIEQGRGTYVSEHPVDFRIGARDWFEQNLLENKAIGIRRVLSANVVAAEKKVAEALEVATNDLVAQIVLVGEADGIPIYIGKHFFSTERFPGIDEAFNAFGDNPSSKIVFRDILKSYGVDDFKRRNIRIRARTPEQKEAHLLRMPVNTPILETVITVVDADNIPVFFGFAGYCSDRVDLVIDV